MQSIRAYIDIEWLKKKNSKFLIYFDSTNKKYINQVKDTLVNDLFPYTRSIHWEFTTDEKNANVIVTFNRGQGNNWSGSIPPELEKIQLDPQSLENEFGRGVVLHEFLHMLGYLHEQENPVGWKNLFNSKANAAGYAPVEIEGDAYTSYIDPFSVMMYPIPEKYQTSGQYLGRTNVLSETDKLYTLSIFDAFEAAPVLDNETVVDVPLKDVKELRKKLVDIVSKDGETLTPSTARSYRSGTPVNYAFQTIGLIFMLIISLLLMYGIYS